MRRFFVFLIFLFLTVPIVAFAQEDGFTLKLNRDFGYGGFTGDIQGLFSFRADGPADLVRVEFYIDDQLVGGVDAAPWRLQFRTDDYPLGIHDLYALGYTTGGQTVRSNVIKREFVEASVGMATAGRIIVPLLVLALAIPLFMALIERRRGKQRRGYGVAGGAVCPKCGKPFARHLWAPNLGLSKFDRCPHCGKWSQVRVASAEALQAAELLLDGGRGPAPAEPALSEEEKLRRRLEESRFD